MPFYSYESRSVYSNNKERYFVQTITPRKKAIDLTPLPNKEEKREALIAALKKARLLLIAKGGSMLLLTLLFLPRLLCRLPQWLGLLTPLFSRLMGAIGRYLGVLGRYTMIPIFWLKNKVCQLVLIVWQKTMAALYSFFIEPFVRLHQRVRRICRIIGQVWAEIKRPVQLLRKGLNWIGDSLMRLVRAIDKGISFLVNRYLLPPMHFIDKVAGKVNRRVEKGAALLKRKLLDLHYKVQDFLVRIDDYIRRAPDKRRKFKIPWPKIKWTIKWPRVKLPTFNFKRFKPNFKLRLTVDLTFMARPFKWLGRIIKEEVSLAWDWSAKLMGRLAEIAREEAAFLKGWVVKPFKWMGRIAMEELAFLREWIARPLKWVGKGIVKSASWTQGQIRRHLTRVKNNISLLFAYWQDTLVK